jgi:hypothetical protein
MGQSFPLTNIFQHGLTTNQSYLGIGPQYSHGMFGFLWDAFCFPTMEHIAMGKRALFTSKKTTTLDVPS